MKLLLFILGICIGIVSIEKPAKAQNYPWCAQYSGDGSMNCGFATFQQCLTLFSLHQPTFLLAESGSSVGVLIAIYILVESIRFPIDFKPALASIGHGL